MGETACKLKIILDGTNVSGLANSLCTAVRYLTAEEVARLDDKVGYDIIKKINEAENLLVDAQKLLVDDVLDYHGPLPNMLK
jgi:hypothetical protein